MIASPARTGSIVAMRRFQALVGAATALALALPMPRVAYASPPEGTLPAPPDTQQTASPAPVTADVPPSDPGAAFVHLEGGSAARLEARDPRTGRWETACRAPCDLPVSLANDYRVEGSTSSTRPFRLDATPGQRIVVRVVFPHRGVHTAGIVADIVGLVGVGVGTLWLLFAPNGSCVDTEMGGCVRSNLSTAQTEAIVVDAVGLATMLAAGALLSVSPIATQATVPSTPPVRTDSTWLRLPVWHESLYGSSDVPAPKDLATFTRHF